MIRWFRYVSYSSLLVRLVEGWAPVADLGPIHGHWSVLCEWQGGGEPS
jgi:hypothetical protein